jgi:hypothetical protein
MQLPGVNWVSFLAMKDNEQDELWELLGKARAPKERPFFAAKVMQAVREEVCKEGERESWGVMGLWVAIRRRWQALSGVLAVGTVAVVAVMFSLSPEVPKPQPNAGTTPTADPLGDLAKVADDSDYLAASLDNLLATKDNSIWLQADPSSLY